MRQVEMEFENGGKFTATLLETEAPKTCETLWNALPMEATAAQARYGGEEFFFKTNLDIEPENEQTKFKAGDIVLNPHPNWRAVITYYGDNMRVSRPWNHFANISEKLDELKEVGERIWLKGTEKIYLRRKL